VLISLSVGGILCLPERDKMQLGGSCWSWVELSAMGGHVFLKSGSEDVPCVTTSMPSRKRIGQFCVSSLSGFLSNPASFKEIENISHADKHTNAGSSRCSLHSTTVRTSCASSIHRQVCP